jgi:hypothetical protein
MSGLSRKPIKIHALTCDCRKLGLIVASKPHGERFGRSLDVIVTQRLRRTFAHFAISSEVTLAITGGWRIQTQLRTSSVLYATDPKRRWL